MTIMYYDQDKTPHSKFDSRYRDYKKCQCCNRIIRYNWKMKKHLSKVHGIEVKRY